MAFADITNQMGTPTRQGGSKYEEYLLAEPEASPSPTKRRLERTVAALEEALAAKAADLVLAAEAGFNLLQEKNALTARARETETMLRREITELEAKVAGGGRVGVGLVDEFQAQVDAALAREEEAKEEARRAGAARDAAEAALEEAKIEAEDAAEACRMRDARIARLEQDLARGVKEQTKLAMELEAASGAAASADATKVALLKAEREGEKAKSALAMIRDEMRELQAQVEEMGPLAAAHPVLAEQVVFYKESVESLKETNSTLRTEMNLVRQELEELKASGGGGAGGGADFAHASSLFAHQMNEEKEAIQSALEAERLSRLATEAHLKETVEVNMARLEREKERHEAHIQALEAERARNAELDKLAKAAERAEVMASKKNALAQTARSELESLKAQRDAAKARVDAAGSQRSDEKTAALKEFKLLRMRFTKHEKKLGLLIKAADRSSAEAVSKRAAVTAAMESYE